MSTRKSGKGSRYGGREKKNIKRPMSFDVSRPDSDMLFFLG